MKKVFTRICEFFARVFESVAFPFVAISVLIDESRRINEDGSWDK